MGCVVLILGAVIVLIKIAWDDACISAAETIAKQNRKNRK
jgi:hypothetical protein